MIWQSRKLLHWWMAWCLHLNGLHWQRRLRSKDLQNLYLSGLCKHLLNLLFLELGGMPCGENSSCLSILTDLSASQVFIHHSFQVFVLFCCWNPTPRLIRHFFYSGSKTFHASHISWPICWLTYQTATPFNTSADKVSPSPQTFPIMRPRASYYRIKSGCFY